MPRIAREHALSAERSSHRSPAQAPQVNSRPYLCGMNKDKKLVCRDFPTQQNQPSIGALLLLHWCWSTHTQACASSRKSRTSHHIECSGFGHAGKGLEDTNTHAHIPSSCLCHFLYFTHTHTHTHCGITQKRGLSDLEYGFLHLTTQPSGSVLGRLPLHFSLPQLFKGELEFAVLELRIAPGYTTIFRNIFQGTPPIVETRDKIVLVRTGLQGTGAAASAPHTRSHARGQTVCMDTTSKVVCHALAVAGVNRCLAGYSRRCFKSHACV
jgi:hypothetical protein